MSNGNADFLKDFGRRVRLGMVGGGFDSIIGETHRIAFQADGLYELVAGAFSVNADISLETGRTLLVDDDRNYLDYREMAEREAGRPDGIDVVVIATPPHIHSDVAIAFLKRGIHVICEKPLTSTIEQAEALRKAVEESGCVFVLTHCYSGFPMPRLARELVANGSLGKIRMIEAEFSGGAAGVALEPDDPAARHWRFRPNVAGREGILGEVGTHTYHLTRYITGMTPTRLSARMQTFVENREVYDNAYLDLEYENGAVGRIWSSYVATGNQHGLSFRIFGDKASLEWREENSEYLHLRPLSGPEQLLRAGQDGTSDFVKRSARFRPGHPEGYILAFANLYAEAAFAIAAAKKGSSASRWTDNLPGINDGVLGIRMIDAAARSQEAKNCWTAL
jgi:predicted dehydrogenase